MRSLRTAMKSSPHSPQLEKACVQQGRHNAAKNKYINKFIEKKKKRNEFLTHATTWMNPENTMLSESSHKISHIV